MNYILHILTLIGIYSILGVSLNMLAGYMGMLSLAHAVYFAIGAYVTGIMSIRFGTPILLNALLALLLAGLLGALQAGLSAKTRGDRFVLMTFALQAVAISVLNNWDTVTGGPMGLPRIPSPSLLGWRVNSQAEFFVLVSFASLTVVLLCARVVMAPLGRELKAVREDEKHVLCSGRNVGARVAQVSAMASAGASLAGVLFAHYMAFVDPTSFSVMESVFLVSIVVLGGAGSLWGPVLGAVVLVTLPEALRFVGMPSAIAANMRQILYGAALVGCMLWRPQGLIGEYDFGRGAKRQ